MPSPLIITILVILHGLALNGFIFNSFIIAVIAAEWAKSRGLNSSELLLLSLSVSNICSIVSVMAVQYRQQFRSIFWKNLPYQGIDIIVSISVLSRFWFTAWLCVFYCIKIVNSTHCLFLWCKQRISWLLPWILAASAAISIISPFFAFQPVLYHQGNTSTDETQVIPEYKIFFVVIGSSCPLLMVILSSVVIVASLYRHMRLMRGKVSSFRSPQTEAHFKAAGTVLFLLFLYLSFYIIQMLPFVKTFEGGMILFYAYAVVVIVYSFAQAAILVLVNPKLKKKLTQMFPGRKL